MTRADWTFVAAIAALCSASGVCFAWAYALHRDVATAQGRVRLDEGGRACRVTEGRATDRTRDA